MKKSEANHPDSLLGQQVEVPANALVQCPAQQSKLIRAERCASCEHCAGLGEDRFPGGSQSFVARFQIACRYPVFRMMQELDEGEAAQ